MACTPKAWIPAPGLLAGVHIPERSRRGAGPGCGLSSVVVGCCPLWARESGENTNPVKAAIAAINKVVRSRKRLVIGTPFDFLLASFYFQCRSEARKLISYYQAE
jgi:hypothetical protein